MPPRLRGLFLADNRLPHPSRTATPAGPSASATQTQCIASTKPAVIPQIRAKAELEPLFDFMPDPADTTEDLDRAQAATAAIRATAQHRLAITPFSLRKAAGSPAQRELIIPFGTTGCVARFEIVSASKVVVLALRHQREEDCH